MALPPFFSPARPGPPPPQPPPPAPFGCPPPPLPSPAFLPPLPQRPGPYPGTSAPFLQPSLGLQPRVPAEGSRRGGGGGSGGGFYSVPPPPLPPPPPQYRPFPGTDAGRPGARAGQRCCRLLMSSGTRLTWSKHTAQKWLTLALVPHLGLKTRHTVEDYL